MAFPKGAVSYQCHFRSIAACASDRVLRKFDTRRRCVSAGISATEMRYRWCDKLVKTTADRRVRYQLCWRVIAVSSGPRAIAATDRRSSTFSSLFASANIVYIIKRLCIYRQYTLHLLLDLPFFFFPPPPPPDAPVTTAPVTGPSCPPRRLYITVSSPNVSLSNPGAIKS